MSEEQPAVRQPHRVTASRTDDPFDRTLSDQIGLPNGAHTAPTTIQTIDWYGNATYYIIQSVRTEENGVTAYVQMVNRDGAVRSILPPAVLAVIDRQRASITTKLRRRHGQRIAEERAARGEQPGFMRKRKRK